MYLAEGAPIGKARAVHLVYRACLFCSFITDLIVLVYDVVNKKIFVINIIIYKCLKCSYEL